MPIISVKAGRCIRRRETNWVDPQPTKGTIDIDQADGLITFHWKSRESGGMAENDELILFPGDCSFQKISSDPSGRTHVLKFESSDGRDFFWFQNASPERDETDAFNIDSILRDPNFVPIPYLDDPVPSQSAAKSNVASTSASVSPFPPQTPAPNSFGNISVPEAPHPQRSVDNGIGSSSQSTFSQEQIGALANLLKQSVAGRAGTSQQAQEDAHLTDILSLSNLQPLLISSPSFLRSLIPHLPSDLPLSDPPTKDEITAILASSQWTEAVAGLDAALRTGALVGSMSSLGMPERAGQGVAEFLEEVAKSGQAEGADDEGQKDQQMQTD